MPYVTIPFSIRYPQITIEEVLNAPAGARPRNPIGHLGDTRTAYYKTLSPKFSDPIIAAKCIVALNDFNAKYEALHNVPRSDLYHSFSIPKSSGGYRRIDAPVPELMTALRDLKEILETQFHALNHTAAFAYVRHRSALDAVKRHQSNGSHWFLKLDCANFFGSTTPDFVFEMLQHIWPFDAVMALPAGDRALRSALDLAFLNGSLPQGTPISPLLTNLVMIPLDHYFFNTLQSYEGQRFVYTRYADDIDISSRYTFDPRKLTAFIQAGFARFHAPYSIKEEKTHYGSSAGRNWILGVMYNGEGNITIGHRKKQAFRAMLNEYLSRRGTESPWSYGEIQQLQGLLSYYRKIEPKYFESVLSRYGTKFGVNVLAAIRADLKK
jgi:hypothetical protein